MINFLDNTASNIFKNIFNQLGVNESLIIDNNDGKHMPLIVQKLSTITFKSTVLERISFAHFYDENGVDMADPKMIFLYNPEYPDKIAPCYFKMDGLGKEEESIRFEDGKSIELRKKMQKGHTIFANVWLQTIMDQQSIVL